VIDQHFPAPALRP